jgi:serine/threonine-protein kinase RsbW
MPAKSAESVELTVPCDAKYLVVVRLAAAGVGNRAGLTVGDIEDIKVAVAEACTNVINHAFDEDVNPAERQIKVRLIAGDGELTVEVEDQGSGFDPKHLERAQQAPLEGSGGLGFGLMRELTDSIRIESAPGSGTKIIMTKRAAK